MPSEYDPNVDKKWGRTLRRGFLLWLEGRNDRQRVAAGSPTISLKSKVFFTASGVALIMGLTTAGQALLSLSR